MDPQGYSYQLFNVGPNTYGSAPFFRWTVTPSNALASGNSIIPDPNYPDNSKVTIFYNPSFTGGYAQINVTPENGCGPADISGIFRLALSIDVPPQVAKPILRNGRTLTNTDTICITDTAFTRWKVPFNAGDAYEYEWKVNPDTALASLPAPDPDDSSAVVFDWNRNYLFNQVTISVKARNGCGYGLPDSVTVNVRRLPAKQGVPYPAFAPTIDSTCQKRYKDSAAIYHKHKSK
jgi:hypothetical protein